MATAAHFCFLQDLFGVLQASKLPGEEYHVQTANVELLSVRIPDEDVIVRVGEFELSIPKYVHACQ